MNNTTYNDITKIIFKRYPRIKGAYCASIAYGVIEYFESKMPAAAPATASGDELPRPDCTYADHSYPAYSAKLVRKIRDEAVSAATKPTADLSKLARYGTGLKYVKLADVQSLLATKPAAAPVVPEGFVLMPKRLTAENGAKSLLMGEFSESTRVTCHECDGSGEDSEFDNGCAECGGEGTIEQKVAVEWDTIKRIYDRAIEHLAATPAASTPAAPTAWLATDLDGRGDVAFTQEEAKRRAGEGCIYFYPLFDVEVPAASTTGAALTAEEGGAK